MMKPNIDDVFEYVKAGENDPDMERTLGLHPDGQELLKQARFICRMLRRESALAGDGGRAASFGAEMPMADEMSDMDLVAESRGPESRIFYKLETPRAGRKRSTSINRLIDEGGEAENLGMLEIASEAGRVVLSYDRSEVATQKDFQGIVIPARGYTVSVSDALAEGEPIAVRVSQSISNLPVKRLEIIFMPDIGPFVRIETDSEGLAELPVPDQPGTLRFNSDISQILHIKLKK